MENKSSELKDGEIVQGIDDHVMEAKNNPLFNKNPLIPFGWTCPPWYGSWLFSKWGVENGKT